MALLKASKRSELGTRKVRNLRQQGLIPAIIYGHGKDTVPVTLNGHDVDLAIHHGQRVLEIKLSGKKENVLIKDIQYDTFGQDILHVDLARVSLDETVEVTVPIVLRGTPAGAAEGGVLQQIAPDVQIRCLVTAIPEEIRASVNDLKVGESLQMRDLPLPDGADLLSDVDAIVCSVSLVAEEEIEEAPPEEAAAEPEIIGEKKAEDQQQEADQKE